MTRLTSIIFCLLQFGDLKADGYPFHPETHEVVGLNLRLPLTESQQTEVAALGHVAFTGEQLGWLRLIYPKIPARLRVIASTYNDNLERESPNPIDCIWTTPTEVGITLRKKRGDDDYTFDTGHEDIGKAVDMNIDFSDIRIAPSGTIYHRGLEITFEAALEVIKLAKQSKDASAIRDPDNPRILVTQPPPFRSQDEDELAKNKKAADVFTALVKYGESIKVEIQPIW